MNLLKLYNALPIPFQNLGCSFEGYRINKKRYGNVYNDCYKQAIKNDELSLDEKYAYRNQKIKEIVSYAYKHVPYYHDTWGALKIDYREIDSLEKLALLPIIDKKTVRENAALFRSDEYMNRPDLKLIHTSGTTGAGLNVYTTSFSDAMNWAIGWREHNKIGINRGDWCAYFAGRPVVPASQKKPPYYRINKAGRQIMFSSFHLNENTFRSYVDALNKYAPKWFHGYPSVISLLAKYMLEGEVHLNYKPNVITLSSETVTDKQRDCIRKAFACDPLQTYGQTEGVAYFRDYIPGDMYVIEDYAAVEFVRMSDAHTHIIGTAFYNRAMPLIRYDTHDMAECIDTKDGRLVKKIDGRIEDYIELGDGSKLGRLDHVFKNADHVIEAQIVQKTRELVWINIVKSDLYSKKDETEIRTLLDERIGGRIKYEIQYVDSIPRTSNGKIRFVISEV